MRWDNFEEDRLLFLDQAMLFEVASARLTGDLSENMIAEGEAFLRVGFFT